MKNILYTVHGFSLRELTSGNDNFQFCQSTFINTSQKKCQKIIKMRNFCAIKLIISKALYSEIMS